MPQAANIVLADALATPVNHTFIPIGKDKDGVFWFEDQSQASPAGYWRVSIQLKRPVALKAGQNSNGRQYRAVIGLHEPILEVVSNSTVSGIIPAPVVSYIPRNFNESVIPERSTLQNRKDLRKMSMNLLGNALVVDVLENLTDIYG